MEVKYKKEFYVLKTKERKVESEAPTVRVKMINNETKVIGMLAPKIQVMLTMTNIKDYNNGLHDILKSLESKLLVYIITNDSTENCEKIKTAFDLDEFETRLEEIVNYKPKGHVHENWMGA